MLPRSRLSSRQSKRFVERRKNRILIIAGISIFCLGIWIFCLARFSNLDILTIDSINISGADSEIAEDLRTAALDSIQGKYLGLVSKSNTLFYSPVKMKAEIQNAAPTIQNVAISRNGLKALDVNIIQKTPAAIVCNAYPSLGAVTGDQESDCYFADSTGLIFKPAPDFSGNVFKKYYVPDLGDSASTKGNLLGEYATSTFKFLELQDFYDKTVSAGINVAAILLKESGEYELYARNSVSASTGTSTDSDMAVIYFNDGRPFSDQLVNLASFWKKMTDSARLNHEQLGFEYIDVRYGSNVFYRLSRR